MKINKIGLILTIVIGAMVLGGCSSANENDPVDQPQEETSNAENVRAVVEAINDPNVRYTIGIDDEAHVFVIERNFTLDGKTYGFDDPETGTSIYAYAIKNNLNREQAKAMSYLLSAYDSVDEKGKKLADIGDYYPEDFTGSFPYKGADLDYATLSNIETEQTDKEGYTKITADVTVHLHLVDGTEEERTFKGSVVPESGNTPIEEEIKEETLNADVMNEELPTDRWIYKDKPE